MDENLFFVLYALDRTLQLIVFGTIIAFQLGAMVCDISYPEYNCSYVHKVLSLL